MRVRGVEAAISTDQSGEETAGRAVVFEDFYRAARDDVARALVLTLGNRELGVEAADEAMMRAYRRWDRIALYDSPAGWVYRVGLNWARSLLRKRRREAGGVFGAIPVDDPVGDVDLERALAALEVPFRAVVVLRLYLDWSVEATAEALGIRPGTVKSRMSRALARLEDMLGGENG